MKRRNLALWALAAVTLAACATSKPTRDYSTTSNKSSIEKANDRLNGVELPADATADEPSAASGPQRRATAVPTLAPRAVDSIAQGEPPKLGAEPVDAVVAPLPLPAFIDAAFGKTLGVPYSTGPGIANRTDVVQLRSSGAMAPDTFLELVTAALKNYGVRVVAEGGAYQILEDSQLKARQPQFIRSRARAGTPANLRPVVQFVELNAIRASDMDGILRQAFDAQQNNLKIEAVDRSNYLILTGLPEDVNAALEIILQMDELQYAGTQAERYTPGYWNAEALVREMLNILNAEGWQASGSNTQPLPILLLSIPNSNDVLIFTRSTQARARVLYWLTELDRPAQRADAPQLFVYNVKYLDAVNLAQTANEAVNGATQGQGATRGAPTAGSSEGPPQAGAPGAARSTAYGNFVVDPFGNRLIFSGTANEYNRVLPLLQSLDTPTPEVLIEVMIAQVTLADSIASGVEWVIENVGGQSTFGNDALDGIISQGGLGLGGAGLAFSIFPKDSEINLNAFAENTQIDILSTPRLVARSGSSANVQVGNEVPILSAQRLPVGGAGGGSNVDVISSVEYRSTGIILQIEPIVFSDNRIDLTISQEVSSALPTAGPISSPTFANTSVTTQLSLEDGATAVIGGLIQDNVTREERGIPFLKDVPLLGRAFSTETQSVDRSELVILITAYILRDKSQKAALANTLSAQIDRTLRTDNLVTLRPRFFP
jgi:general secretion pathway protein D